ncbi:hypothetical protein KUTeg_001894 [Tegillarca granosa]|uniref:Nucleoside diphosphate kinase-like domain-containing protein n=1 Tax=Tegillarca granosa TaxID=220873 RepID=A0ABQ9FWE4_TEGGR|nr:hypothetical protein KUTeg_001894 [Tegillarca granosa]
MNDKIYHDTTSYIVDVYQEWCGPCSGMIANLRRLKNELGDDLLHFAVAKADTIDALEKYRGKCEPCFLFFGIKDTAVSQVDESIKDEEEEEEKEGEEEGRAPSRPQSQFEREGKKEVTVALIKPDAVQAGKDFFEDMVKFMTSGPSHILVLTKGRTGENIINEFRDLIGPTNVEEAKEQHPESLRAKHGAQTYMNALHGSSSAETAHRELAFFFPDFVIPEAEGKPKLQRTLALVRPDAFKHHKEEILKSINDAGFKVAMQKEMHLTKEQAEDFYKEHKGQEYFEELTTRMSSGPLLALGLAREDAITGWRNMLGPTEVNKAKEEAPDSLRAKFAVEDTIINQIHGSDTEEAAKKELDFFFPMQQTIAAIKPDAYGTKDEIIEKIHDAGFKIAARKETTLSREVAEEFYSDHKDKEYYNDLVEHMVSGPTLFMVLSREDAVDGWRALIGPTDPDKAKEEKPESLRAAYGSSVLQNAVHGSSDPDHAKTSIQRIFGDLDFNADGTVKVKEEEESQQDKEKPVSVQHPEAEDVAPEDRDKTEADQMRFQGEIINYGDSIDQPSSEQQQPQGEQTQDQQQEPSQEQQQPSEGQQEQSQSQEESKPEETSEQKTEESTEQKTEEGQAQEGVEAKTEETQKEEESKPEETQKEGFFVLTSSLKALLNFHLVRRPQIFGLKIEHVISDEPKPTESEEKDEPKSNETDQEKGETEEQKPDDGEKKEDTQPQQQEAAGGEEQKTEQTEQATEGTTEQKDDKKEEETPKTEDKPSEEQKPEEGEQQKTEEGEQKKDEDKTKDEQKTEEIEKNRK